MNRCLKVIISAYACEPHKGSEGGVGWNWSKQIARFAEVWVITRANNKKVIEEEVKKNPEPNMHFVYYDVPKWLSFWKKKTRGLYLYYLFWQIGAYRLAKKLHKQIRFDVAHHLTFGNLWLPTFIPFLRIPFIWGPIGGGEQVAKIFRKGYSLRAKIKENLRDFIIPALKINPIFRFNCKRAHTIIIKTKDSANEISENYRNKVIILTDVAVNYNDVTQIAQSDNEQVQLIAVGTLDGWRGFDLLIKASSKVKEINNNIFLVIVGDGCEMKHLKKTCREHNVLDKVLFTGNIEKLEYQKYMVKANIVVNPCLKEGGVTVLFDALTFGLPVVCLDIAGASEIINDECGIKIKPINPQQTITELADALLKLAKDPELRRKMGEAGRKRVMEHYTWDKKGEFIRKVYKGVLGHRI